MWSVMIRFACNVSSSNLTVRASCMNSGRIRSLDDDGISLVRDTLRGRLCGDDSCSVRIRSSALLSLLIGLKSLNSCLAISFLNTAALYDYINNHSRHRGGNRENRCHS